MTALSPSTERTPAETARGIGALVQALRITDRHVVIAGTLLLLLPNILFALQLQALPAAIMLAGAMSYVALTWQSIADGSVLSRTVSVPRLSVCTLVALLLLVLGGECHLVFANWDWLWRDSVLADLSRASFPPTYDVGGERFFLRAPLGMYMLPAMVAKATSLAVGHVALLLQNTAFLALSLYLLATLSGRQATLVIFVFLSFSGLDVVGQMLKWLIQGHSLSTFVLPSQIENWIGIQYSSVITQIFWVPNHALPSYWLMLLAFLCAKHEVPIWLLGLAMASSLFWSPFALIGTLPFAAFLLVRFRTTVFCWRFWLAAGTALCFLPVALYLKTDAAQVPHGFIPFQPAMIFFIGLFLLVEIPHLAVIRRAWVSFDASLRGILLVAIVVLVFLPTVRVGSANDLVMRASIPALMLVSYAFAQALHFISGKRPILLAAGIALMIVGSVTPLQEIVRAEAFPAFAISDCNIVTVWQKIWAKHRTIENYLAHESSATNWLMRDSGERPLVNERQKACWPDLPIDPRSDIQTQSNDMILQSSGSAPRL